MKLCNVVKSSYKQILLVIIAFSTMVLFSNIYAGNIVQEQMLYCGEETMNAIAAKANTIFNDAEILLESAAFITKAMMLNGAADEEIQAFYYGWSDTVGSSLKEFLSIYTSTKNTQPIDSMRGRVLPDDFDASTRSWYIGALENKGKVYYTEPYHDIGTHEKVISISKCIYDNNNDFLGIIVIDIDVQTLAGQIENLRLMDGGHGVLLNEEYKYIVHGHDYIGEQKKTDEHLAPYAQLLEEKGNLSAEQVVACDGEDSITFYRNLDNGWYIGVIVPVNEYYSEVRHMTVILAIWGCIMMFVLTILLIMLAVGKLRSEEASKIKSSFIANMSHEIRTPLNSITSMSELILREAPENPVIWGYVSEIKQAGSHLLSIINDILDISKIEAGKLDLVSAEYELPSVLNDVISIIKTRLDSTQVELIVDISPDLPFKVTGDDMRVKQVLLNLLSNAVKYTHTGFVKLTAEGVTENGKVTLKLEVSDSGYGIKSEDLDNLFKQFERVNTKRNRTIEGTGLGLAIAKDLCDMMNGRIEVSSQYGIGSIFTAYIQQDISAYIPMVQIENADSIRVIVLDYSMRVLDSITGALNSMGIQYDAFWQPETFEKKIAENHYDFVFVPFNMQGGALLQIIPDSSTVVFIAEFSQVVDNQNILILRKPVTSLQIGNILQNKANLPSYRRSGDAYISFSAPEARILIVDDNITNLKVAVGLMSPYHMQVDTALSGREAIDKIHNIGETYDLVFMDHMMPDMDGIETTIKIRRSGGEYYKTLPVIALTANAVNGAKQLFIDNGMNDFLAKPIDTKKLNAILKEYIPKEKRISGAEATQVKISNSNSEIKNVNTVKGIENCGGTVEGYLSVLSVFHTDGLSKIPVLQSMLMNLTDIKEFTTLIHGLKSACASIGALDVSGLAAELEAAGLRGDMDFICSYLESFINDYSALLNDIFPAITHKESREAVLPMGSDDILRKELNALENALKICNSTCIDEILEKLIQYSWDEKTYRMLNEVKRNAEIFEFDQGLGVLRDGAGV